MKKYLLIKLRALGDTVLLTSAVQSLRRAEPQAEIHVLIPEIWAPLLEHQPEITRLWLWKGSLKKSRWKNILTLLPKLRKEAFTDVANFHASPTSAWIGRLSGAPYRAHHFHGFQDPDRFSTVKIPDKKKLKPILERDLDTLKALGIPGLHIQIPHLVVTPQEREWAENYLEKEHLTGPLLILGLGASRPTKQWPLESFVELARRWITESSGSVLAICSPQEHKLAKEFSALSQKLHPRLQVASHFHLREIMSILSEADLFMGNDSGPKHMAVALGLPTVTVFGPENPYEWHPYSRTDHPVHFLENLACRTNVSPNGMTWCGLSECIEEKHRCLREISPTQVYMSCKQILESQKKDLFGPYGNSEDPDNK